MKKALIPFGVFAALCFTGCGDDDDDTNVWEVYREWRDTNTEWVAEQEKLLDEDGNLFYEKLSSDYRPEKYILIHWFNDRSKTQMNLVPMFTSTVTTKYQLFDINDEKLDSSESNTDGVFNTTVSAVIDGWQNALMNMHVGDTVQIVVPYQSGYGSTSTGTIQPYSTLRFNVRLVDIPAYEVKP